VYNRYIQGDIVMGSKDLSNISNYIDVHVAPVRKLHTTIEILDKNDRTIETIQGLATGGSLSIQGDSLIRRTGTIEFVLFDMLLPRQQSLLWMTNKIRVYQGLEDMTSDGSITHFCLGTFYISEPSIKISNDSRTITINLEDNMMRWEQEELDTQMKFEAGTPLHTAMEMLMNRFGEFNTQIEFTDLSIPHTLEFNYGDSVMSIIERLRDLYMDWECYYDVDGTFVFRKMKMQREDGEPISWVFDNKSDLIISFSERFTYKNVKNKVVVVGVINEKTGETPRAEAIITNEDSPFHENNIGLRTKVFNESTLGTVDQCDAKARYELFQLSTFQEQVSLTTVPIYYLDANDIIEVRNHATGELERYIIDAISMNLGVGETMSINAHKLYYNTFDISTGNLEKYRKSADIIIDGIKNKGWLSLSEQRIKEYLGLEGDGSDLFVRFEYDGLYGVTAYVTAYSDRKQQSLTIDLADFENVQGDSGDIGQTKAEYADRILGHEMVHVVMNNAIGVTKTSVMPVWFKEGVSEYIHGADERLKKSIVKDDSINDILLDGLVARAVGLLNGLGWQSVNDDYSAGYLIVKYLDHQLMLNGKTMKNLMDSIIKSQSTGDIALKDAIVENTKFSTYSDFVENFEEHAVNYVKYNIELNIGQDELDTGSIAGTDGRGKEPLNAEDVFNNNDAVRGVTAFGFNVIFNRP
jgi:hypothetical protein